MKQAKRIIINIIVCVVLLEVMKHYIVQTSHVVSGSMSPTFIGKDAEHCGDYVYVEKLSYRFHDPKRGDVVLINANGLSPFLNQNGHYLKRIAGLPGDRVKIEHPYIYINGVKLTEPPIFSKIAASTNGYLGFNIVTNPAPGTTSFHMAEGEEKQLLAGEYFVISDNTEAMDSRLFGAIRRNNILGRAVWIYFPFNRVGRTE